MKKSILALGGILASAVFLQAQVVNKGDRLFGGSFSFSFYSLDGSGPNYNSGGNAGLFPSFAWAIKENTVMGIKGNISFSRSETIFSATDKRITNSFGAGPGIFIKKYRTIKNKFGIYFDHNAAVYYGMSKEKRPNFPALKSDTWGGGYQFNPGVFYKFSDNFLGEANIGGAFFSYYVNENTKNYGAGVSFLQYFNLGIAYRIAKKS